jgi:hypothetical protein
MESPKHLSSAGLAYDPSGTLTIQHAPPYGNVCVADVFMQHQAPGRTGQVSAGDGAGLPCSDRCIDDRQAQVPGARSRPRRRVFGPASRQGVQQR